MSRWNEGYAGLGSIQDFEETCAQYAWFFHEGWLSMQLAVDACQHLAELWGIDCEIGPDAVQALIAFDGPAESSFADDDYVQRLVARWEAADAERPVAAIIAPPPCRTPQSTIDAFWIVVQRNDPAYLARWLSEHHRDAAYLHEIWGRKCSTAAA